jgi:predicted lipoprotein with Yx(FWY)xxD motif
MNKLLLATLATAFTANVAIAESVVEVNGVLADAAGRTLYTFDKDADNKSNCNGGCAAAWPPYLVKEGDRNPANIGVVRRDDNTLQWALNGKPLYFFAADAQAGDAKGNGQGGVWHAVHVAEVRAKAPPAAVNKSVGSYDSYGGY